MLNATNCKAITEWTAKDYAIAYRDYFNDWAGRGGAWFSNIFPEEEEQETILDFLTVCKKMHELGF